MARRGWKRPAAALKFRGRKAPVILSTLALSVITSLSKPRLDPIFNSGAGTDNFAEQVLPLQDGRILLCGAFGLYNGEWAPNICRLNEDGTLDHSFKSTVSSWIRHMVLQPDGRIIAGGAFSSVEGVSRNLIARLNSDGTLDPSFEPGLGFQDKLVPPDPNPPYIFWMALQKDGKILVTGSFARFNGKAAHGIARLNPDGTLDESFQMGKGLNSWGRFVLVLPNGQIMLTGWFTDYNGFSCSRMVRLNSDGTPDPSFRPNFGDKTAIYTVAPLPDGKMIVAGHSKSDFGYFHREIARLNADGSEDSSFVGHTNDRTESVLVQPNGKILASGWFWAANDQIRGRFARFNSDGTLDEEFQMDADYFIWSLALDSNERILCAGGFPHIGGKARKGVARILDSQDPQSESTPPPPVLTSPEFSRGLFIISVQSDTNYSYTLEWRNAFSGGNWQPFIPVRGNGGTIYLYDPENLKGALAGNRFYRARID